MDLVAIAVVGSGGAGVMTAAEILLRAAAADGHYGTLTKSFGPQIRGGEAAAYVVLSSQPVEGPPDELPFHPRQIEIARFPSDRSQLASSLIRPPELLWMRGAWGVF